MCRAKHRKYALAGLVAIACFALLSTCEPVSLTTSTSTPTGQPSPTTNGLPDFLSYLRPLPGYSETQAGHSLTQHTWAYLRLDVVAEAGETLDLGEMQQRVELVVDGQHLEISMTEGLVYGTPHALVSGSFPPELGQHDATIRVLRTSGEVLEFSWSFTLTAEEPSVPGLPYEFRFVRPLPDTTITLHQYQEEDLVPPYYHGPANLQGSICVGVMPSRVVQPGEFLDDTGVGSKYRIVSLDGEPPSGGSVTEYIEPLEVPIYDETGCVVASYVGPNQAQCWHIDLDPGEHEVTVELEKASGEIIEYTWQFTITGE